MAPYFLLFEETRNHGFAKILKFRGTRILDEVLRKRRLTKAQLNDLKDSLNDFVELM